jgi:hypothetical protein
LESISVFFPHLPALDPNTYETLSHGDTQAQFDGLPGIQKNRYWRSGLMFVHRTNIEATEIPSFDRTRKMRLLSRLYAFHHTKRFEWLRHKIATLNKQDVAILEIGCNDARSVDFIPVPIKRYVGLDAGWRSGWRNGKAYGLDAARLRFQHRPQFEFRHSEHHEDLDRVQGTFDLAIALETFEYLLPSELELYVSGISRKLNDAGCILATMPNEKGIPLLLKSLGSRLSGVSRSEYPPEQFWNALIGRMDRVPRAVRGRKGFDYCAMAELVRRYFSHTRLEPVEPAKLPLWLSLNVGMFATKKILMPALA